jgi:hypothetical protein
MKKAKEPFAIEEYKAIAQEISDRVVRYQDELIQKLMPASQRTLGTLYYVSLHVMTKSICMICLNDTDAREKMLNDIAESLPRLVRDSRVIHTKDIPKKAH